MAIPKPPSPSVGSPPEGPAKPDETFFISGTPEEGSGASATAPDYFEEQEKKSRRRGHLLIGVGVTTAAALLGGILILEPFGMDLQGGEALKGGASQGAPEAPGDAASGAPANGVTLTSETVFWISEEGTPKFPTSKAAGLSTVYGDEVYGEKQMADLLAAYEGTELNTKSNVLPSEEAGFTSKAVSMENPDGTLNPYYTFATREDYQEEVLSSVERLINPVYGDWKDYQYPSGEAATTLDLTRFEDMFTPKYLASKGGAPVKEYFPLLADWEGNDYGKGDQLLEVGPRWMGKVKDSSSTFTFNNATNLYEAKVTVDVVYSSWTRDQSTITQEGTLTLDLVSNAGLKEGDRKFLINDALLTLKDA